MVSRSLKTLLLLNAVFLVWIAFSSTGNAQRPPNVNADGIPFFNVNINPTDIPPMVNINPHQIVPRVAVTEMPKVAVYELPEMRLAPMGCQDRRNFQTSVGRSIPGPMVVTYLNAPAAAQITLSGGGEGTRKITLANGTQLASAMYLKPGQRMDFDQDILYSGCLPQ
jgi:hypothetical protein